LLINILIIIFAQYVSDESETEGSADEHRFSESDSDILEMEITPPTTQQNPLKKFKKSIPQPDTRHEDSASFGSVLNQKV
jgi:hypothetical protein